jgi:hypothetical protein
MNDLCAIGRGLQDKAAAYDHVFKTRLLAFFSDAHNSRNEDEMLEIERLGVHHRAADEAFNRHQQLCDACAKAMNTQARSAALAAPHD